MPDLPDNPIVPAYRLLPACRNAGWRPISGVIVLRCPGCGDIHTHGAGNGSTMQWRGSHCLAGSPLAGKNLRLLICGEVKSPRMLPRHSAEDIANLNIVVAEIERKLMPDESRRDATEDTFEADPVAVAVRNLILEEHSSGWTATAIEWLAALSERVSEDVRKRKVWPLTAQSFANRIVRIAPLLRQKGFVVEKRHSRVRTITIAPLNGSAPEAAPAK